MKTILIIITLCFVVNSVYAQNTVTIDSDKTTATIEGETSASKVTTLIPSRTDVTVTVNGNTFVIRYEGRTYTLNGGTFSNLSELKKVLNAKLKPLIKS